MKNPVCLYILISTLLILVGFIFGHGFASTGNSLLLFTTSNTAGWMQFAIGITIGLAQYKLSSEQSKKLTNTVLRQNQLTSSGEKTDLVTRNDETLNSLSINKNASDALNISQPQITNISLTKHKRK